MANKQGSQQTVGNFIGETPVATAVAPPVNKAKSGRVEVEHDTTVPNDILYETDPDKVDHDIVVFVEEKGALYSHRSDSATIILRPGQRAKGAYLRSLVDTHQVDGLALCYLQQGKFLIKLEDMRRENAGLPSLKEEELKKKKKG